MKEINFISCGLLGDFIHSLYAVKNICERDNAVANIYLSDRNDLYGGDVWSFSTKKAHEDLIEIMKSQSFVNKFEVLSDEVVQYTNMNAWRTYYGCYRQSWSQIMSGYYSFPIKNPYKWINCDKHDSDILGKIVIHRSGKRHNNEFDWNKILQTENEEFVFVTCSINEWDAFQFKNERVKLKLVSTIDEMATVINSCKLFIGNQSSPFALASALDVNRIVELYNHIEGTFYMGEKNFSEKISWYLDNSNKYFSNNSSIKL